jgi:hypothetical protein
VELQALQITRSGLPVRAKDAAAAFAAQITLHAFSSNISDYRRCMDAKSLNLPHLKARVYLFRVNDAQAACLEAAGRVLMGLRKRGSLSAPTGASAWQFQLPLHSMERFTWLPLQAVVPVEDREAAEHEAIRNMVPHDYMVLRHIQRSLFVKDNQQTGADTAQ